MEVSWSAANARRLQRHALLPPASVETDPADIAAAICGAHAQVLSAAELSIALRIQQAKLLLVDGDLKVYEVAERVGFQSLPHFNRVFKQMTGQSPNEYRKWLNV